MIRVLHIPILLSLSIAHVEVDQCTADGCPKRGRQGSAMLQRKRDSAMVETAESDSCAKFCAHNSQAWESKCKMKGCSACPECDAFTTTTVPLAPSRPPAYYGCHPDQSGMKSGRQESTAEGIAECFDRCRGAGHMYAGLGCYNHEKIKCFCYSYETGVSPIIPMSAGGNCYEASTLCSGATNPTAGYEIGSEHSVAMYGLMEAQDYVVDADYEPMATQPTQAGASAWRHLQGECTAPSGTSFSTLLLGSSLLGHTVVVPAGSTYLVDQSVTVDGTVTVEAGATLAFADIADLTLSVGKLEVYGTVQLGTEGCPLQSSGVTITLTGSKAGEVLYGADRTTKKGIIVNEGAVLDMHGKPYTPTWSRLSTTAANGSSTIKLQDAVDWEVNQYVVLVTTRHGDIDDHENEVRKITAVSGSEITLDSPLDHVHFGGAEYQGEVGLLSRSITVQGDEQSESESFGGHTLCMKGATCRISYVLGYRMGQMNVMGRYPFHFHKMGDVQQASYFRGLAVVHSFFRAYTIHGTSNITLSSSVAYDVMGTAVYMEDGLEMDNLIEFNLIARVQAIKPLEDPNGGYEAIEDATDAAEQWIESVPDRIVPTDLTPACFYITNQRNRWVGNVASGGFAGFIFPATPYALGDSAQTAPDFQPVLEDTIEFDGNTAHSGGQYWKYGGCMYVGGILINPDPSNTSHYAYNFAKFPRSTSKNKFDSIYRGKLHVSNAKFWGCKTALLAWGAELDSRPLTTVDKTEFHDNMMGIQFFAHNWISNAVFTAQTANVDVWKGWYAPHTAFKAYDQFMQTLFVNITVRGYKGPSDVGFLILVVTDLSRQEGFTSIASPDLFTSAVMAPKGRQMKRPAAAAVAAPVAKKPAVSEPEAVAKKPAGSRTKGPSKRCSLVAKALAIAPGYPSEVLEVLAGSLPQCLAVAKEERHVFQERMVEMIGEVLKSSESAIQAQLNAADEVVKKVDADKAARESEEASIKDVVEEKEQAEEAAEKALEESTGALNAAKEALSTAQEEQKACDAELDAADEKRARLTSTKTDVWDPLVAGTSERGPADVKTLMKVANEFSFDPSLLSALPVAVGKAPGARGTFDTIVLEQAEGEFRRCTEALEQTITTGDSAKKDRAAKVSSAASELEQAAESESACQSALKTAKAETKEAEASRKVASRALQALGPERKRAAAELERLSASLEEFRVGPLMAFQELLERTVLAPAAEVPAAEGGTAAEGEAPEEPAAAEGEPAAAE